MKVLHFAENFSKPTETFVKRYVQKSTRFAETAVVAFNIYNVDDKLKQDVSLFNITNRLYTRKNLWGIARFIYETLSGRRLWYKQFNNIIESFKPDVIHCHFGNTGIMMMHFNKVYKSYIPYVTSFYGYDISSQPATDKEYKKQLSHLWEQGTAFFAEAPELAKKITALGCPETKVLINPLLIPTKEYPLKENYRVVSAPIKFLFVGRFVEKKGLHKFLLAISEIRSKIGDFTIDIVGAGPLQSVYEEIIDKQGLQSAVIWRGIMPHDEIISMMKDFDFLVHPSETAKDNDSEGGAPTIIIEAQAIGLPVITSNHADIPYIMGYDSFICKEHNMASLVQNIERIIKCEDIQCYTWQGREKVIQQHDLYQSNIYEANLKKLANQI